MPYSIYATQSCRFTHTSAGLTCLIGPGGQAQGEALGGV